MSLRNLFSDSADCELPYADFLQSIRVMVGRAREGLMMPESAVYSFLPAIYPVALRDNQYTKFYDIVFFCRDLILGIYLWDLNPEGSNGREVYLLGCSLVEYSGVAL